MLYTVIRCTPHVMLSAAAKTLMRFQTMPDQTPTRNLVNDRVDHNFPVYRTFMNDQILMRFDVWTSCDAAVETTPKLARPRLDFGPAVGHSVAYAARPWPCHGPVLAMNLPWLATLAVPWPCTGYGIALTRL